MVKAIPDGYHSVTPYLTVSDLPRLVDFLVAAFGAKTTEMLPDASGTVRHAEVKIGDSMVMIGQESEKWKAMPSNLYLYTEDAQGAYDSAMKAGGTSIMPPAKQFYGDINGGVQDPVGNVWWISQHVEDMSDEEMKKRAAESMKK